MVANADREGECWGTFDAEMVGIQDFPGSLWQAHTTDLGVVDGSADWMDRLRAAGNACVPQVAAFAFHELWGRLT